MKHIVLFVFLALLPPVLPTGNRADFRVAKGIEVTNMNDDKENYGHLVRIFTVYTKSVDERVVMKTGNVPMLQTVGRCTGMKVTSGQLQGESNELGYLPKTALADYVLTAGHCVNWNDEIKGTKGRKKLHPHHIYVVSGSELAAPPSLKWQKSRKSYKLIFKHLKPGAQVSQVDWASYKYPDDQGYKYNETTEEASEVFDIAILKLVKKLKTPVIPFQLNDNLKPGAEGSRDKCRFAGWGIDEIGRNDDKLKKVKPDGMVRYTETECKDESIRGARKYFGDREACLTSSIKHDSAVRKSTTCTRHEGGSVGCDGDSGGPLLCQHKNDDGTYSDEKVVGVFSEILHDSRRKIPKCFGSSKIKSLSCHDQKKIIGDFLAISHRISEAETKAYLKKCQKVIANPESAEAEAKTECFAKQYGSLEVETQYQTQ